MPTYGTPHKGSLHSINGPFQEYFRSCLEELCVGRCSRSCERLHRDTTQRVQGRCPESACIDLQLVSVYDVLPISTHRVWFASLTLRSGFGPASYKSVRTPLATNS